MNPEALTVARGGMWLPHEQVPAGVPASYDWHARPKLNPPRADMPAVTGWLQAFATGPVSVLQMTGLQTWVRVGAKWTRLQQGTVEGAVFAPDFAGNVNNTPKRLVQADGVALVEWTAGAWHCWPARRATLPAGVAEIAVACQVRAIGSPLLVGCGADYWRSLSAPYGDGTNNPGVGIGRLLTVADAWRWVGFSSAP